MTDSHIYAPPSYHLPGVHEHHPHYYHKSHDPKIQKVVSSNLSHVNMNMTGNSVLCLLLSQII